MFEATVNVSIKLKLNVKEGGQKSGKGRDGEGEGGRKSEFRGREEGRVSSERERKIE